LHTHLLSFFHLALPPPTSTLFPYTTLFRSFSAVFEMDDKANVLNEWFGRTIIHSDRRFTYEEAQEIIETKEGDHAEAILKLNELDRKSTRLNSSHVKISYAVFCLKKKKKKT